MLIEMINDFEILFTSIDQLIITFKNPPDLFLFIDIEQQIKNDEEEKWNSSSCLSQMIQWCVSSQCHGKGMDHS